MAAQQTQIVIPGVAVQPYQLTVNRAPGNGGTEVITSLVLNQMMRVTASVGNPSAEGFSTFTWTWSCPPETPTDDLATALQMAGWDVNLPCLDSTKGYTITVSAS